MRRGLSEVVRERREEEEEESRACKWHGGKFGGFVVCLYVRVCRRMT